MQAWYKSIAYIHIHVVVYMTSLAWGQAKANPFLWTKLPPKTTVRNEDILGLLCTKNRITERSDTLPNCLFLLTNNNGVLSIQLSLDPPIGPFTYSQDVAHPGETQNTLYQVCSNCFMWTMNYIENINQNVLIVLFNDSKILNEWMNVLRHPSTKIHWVSDKIHWVLGVRQMAYILKFK